MVKREDTREQFSKELVRIMIGAKQKFELTNDWRETVVLTY